MRGMRKAVYWIVFVVAAIATGAYFGREPWAGYQIERAQAKRATERMRQAEAERAELMKQDAKYSSDAGKEQLLREKGYRRKGEKSLNDES